MTAAQPPLQGVAQGATASHPALVSLAPEFSWANHGVYRNLVIQAVERDASVRNLALTGAYGTGKSSVLHAVTRHFGDRVVELSLASLASEQEPDAQAGGNPAATTPTNRIQKEIVKQLLYRLPPSKTPQSRFPRATTPAPALGWSLQWAGVVFTLLLGVGLPQHLVEALVAPWWRQLVAYACLFALAVGLVWVTRRIIRGRVSISSVTAGPATVTLSPTATSYFDQYLDEIVYFFEVSRCNIVVFEDIDRFDDIHIFETLRALNTVLNGAETLRERAKGAGPGNPNRRIVFIYAIRDSVFERIGTTGAAQSLTDSVVKSLDDLQTRDTDLVLNPSTPALDRVQEELMRANRTKFFDLVVPIVPFITASNARDLMSVSMAAAGREISTGLVKLVARHVADMRLILNIRNEFEVYRSRLLDIDQPMPGLTDDRLFALIVYKNTHLSDFEAIRLQASRLDTLYRLWRRLINDNVASVSKANRALRQGIAPERASVTRARDYGSRLLRARDGVAAGVRTAAQIGASMSQVYLEDRAVADDEVSKPEYWAAVSSGSTVGFGAPGRAPYFKFSAADLALLLGLPADATAWSESDVEADASTIEANIETLWFLRHHTWQNLYLRTDLKVNVGAEAEALYTFRELVDRVLDSRLARELVREGFLDENFALYVSQFYGEHVRAGATEYIMRCVRPGVPDTSFVLSADDVDAIIADEGAAVLNDPSMYNVSVLDHLLARRPTDAVAVVRQLLTLGDAEHAFVDAYMAGGSDPIGLISLMADSWPGVFVYLIGQAAVDDARRLNLVNAALRASSRRTRYDSDEAVRAYLDAHFGDLPVITDPPDSGVATAAFGVLARAGACLATVEPLNRIARDQVIALRLYQVSAANLMELAGSPSISLDALLSVHIELYRHALENPVAYLDAIRGVGCPTVAAGGPFASIVSDAATAGDKEALNGVIQLADRACRIDTLESVPQEAWPTLVADDRAPSTYQNVRAYTEIFGVDLALATLLRRHRTLNWPTGLASEQRQALAVRLINSGDVLPIRLRTGLAKSLQPDTIPASAIKPSSGPLVANLLRERLLADDAETFSRRLMPDWATMEAAIKNSKAFQDFVSPEILPVSFIPSLIKSSIRNTVRLRVVRSLSAYVTGATQREVEEVASALISRGWSLAAGTIETLRTTGARPVSIVRLLGQSKIVSDDDVRATLRLLPKPYASLADPRGARPRVPDDAQHRVVLDRLQGARVVKRHEPDAKRPGLRTVTTYFH